MKILSWNKVPPVSIISFILLILAVGIYLLYYFNNKNTPVVLSAEDLPEFMIDSSIASASPEILEYIVISETPIPSPTKKPSPTPKPTLIIYSSSQFDEWFTRYSQNESIDRNLLWKIAVCESGLNPRAVNGIYGGLFQFSSSSWIANRRRMNLDTNPELRFNPEEAIRTAAFRIATNGTSAWPNCYN